jgi:hypothetical protein
MSRTRKNDEDFKVKVAYYYCTAKNSALHFTAAIELIEILLFSVNIYVLWNRNVLV